MRRYAATGAEATLLVGRSGEAVLVADGLPPAPAGKTYEAWVLAGGRASAAGLFRGSVVVLTRPVLPGAAVVVSLEPARGSRRPAGPVLLRTETA